MKSFASIAHLLFLIALGLFNFQIFAEQNLQTANTKREIKWLHKIYINSTINPATFEYINNVATKIKEDRAEQSLVLIEMDTPGGLVTTTKDILTLFGKSPFPYVVWVHPEGGSATSAGALIASGAHYIFMSEGTNIGAATPIEMSGNIGGEESDQSDLRAKAINDLVALVRSLSSLRGRNGDKFSKMITEAASFTAQEAQRAQLINGLANTQNELLTQLDNSTIKLQGKPIQLQVAKSLKVIEHPMDPGQKLLNILAHPSLAYIFFLIGAALIYLELQAPGGFIAGSIGAVCLVLAAIGLQVLPLNFGALGLIILSFVLFVLEVFVTSFGILSLAGFASLIFGSLFLYRTEDSYITFSTSLVIASVMAIASFLGVCLYFIMRDHKNIGRESFNSQAQKIGKVIKELPDLGDHSQGQYFYQVKVGGEFWKAKSQEPLNIGDHIKVRETQGDHHHNVDDLILDIQKA